MPENKIKITPAILAFMFSGIVNFFVIFCLAIVQVFEIFTLQIGRPTLSNVSGIELTLVGVIVLLAVVGILLSKLTSATSQDANPPAASYLKKKAQAKIFLLILFVLIFFTA